VNAQDDAMLGKLASSLNVTLSKADLVLKLQENLQMLGLGFAVMIVLQIAAILLAGLFLYFVKLWKIENGVRRRGLRALPAQTAAREFLTTRPPASPPSSQISAPPRKLGDKHVQKIFGFGRSGVAASPAANTFSGSNELRRGRGPGETV
jgi:hypothetical protein